MSKSSKKFSKYKIALVGPIAPFRGGIAKYNTQLHAALDKQSELLTVSFKRQYPSWLYPGESDLDPSGQKLDTVAYLIDIYSPLSLKKATDLIIRAGCQAAVLNWWTLIWQPGMVYIMRRLQRHGVKTILLCHNIYDHDASMIKRKASIALIKQADAYVVQSTDEAELMKDIKPSAEIINTKSTLIFDDYPEPSKVLKKRGRLELLFFGFIRPYKGLDVLIEALERLDDTEVYVTVVGEIWSGKEELIKKIKAAGLKNVELHLKYVNDEEAANYFARADVIVLPYKSATGSAVAPLAFRYSKPVLATRVGVLKEIVIPGETGWLIEPDSVTSLTKAIKSIQREDAKRLEPSVRAFRDKNSWDSFAKQLINLSQKLT